MTTPIYIEYKQPEPGQPFIGRSALHHRFVVGRWNVVGICLGLLEWKPLDEQKYEKCKTALEAIWEAS